MPEPKIHYATRYKNRIKFLEDAISEYYDSIFEAKLSIKDRNGLTGTPVHCGRPSTSVGEERMPITTYEGLCRVIENLPLMDCGI